MTAYGLMIDYEWCTGCHSCEVACKMRLGLPEGQFGIKIADEKPWQAGEGAWEYKFVPIPTGLCDLCDDRTAEGKMPSCVQNCCAHVIEYAPIRELAKRLEDKGSKAAIFVP